MVHIMPVPRNRKWWAGIRVVGCGVMSASNPRPGRLLYILTDGVRQDYFTTLFLPILSEVKAQTGLQIHVLYPLLGEPCDYETKASCFAKAARERDIELWTHRLPTTPHHLSRAALIADVAAWLGVRQTLHPYDVIAVRGPKAGAGVLLSLAMHRTVPLVYDCDGFFVDERVEFGGWSEHSTQATLFRHVEHHLVQRAHRVIVKTEHANQLVQRRHGLAPNEVITAPNGSAPHAHPPLAPSERMTLRNQHDVPPGAPWVIYCGSVGPQYLPRAMGRIFETLLRDHPQARFTVLTGSPRDVMPDFHLSADARGRCDQHRVPPESVPALLASADLGLCLRLDSPSQRSVSPIKLGEYLLSGLPVVATRSIMDPPTDPRAAHVIEGDPHLGEAADDTAAWFRTSPWPDREGAAQAARDWGLRTRSLPLSAERYAQAITDALQAARRR